MKKRKLILFILITFFMFSLRIYAKDQITCDKTAVEVGGLITCTIDIKDERIITTDESFLTIDSINGAGNTQKNNSEAVFKISGKITYIALKEGNIPIEIRSPSSSSEIVSQTIAISKKTNTTQKTTTTTTRKKSSNNYLSSIKIDGKEIEGFAKNKNRYYINFSNKTEKINISAVSEDKSASIDINGPKLLEVGDNEYTIGVTSEDNTTKFYKILVTRKKADEEKSSNTKLSSIKVKGYTINFDGSSKTYYLKVKKDVSKLNVSVKTVDKNATYKISGNKNIKEGSTIKIIVNAENNDTDTYRIIINKEKNNILLPISIILIIITIIILIFIVIKKNKRKKKKIGEIDKPKNKDDNHNLEKTIEISTLENEKTILNNKDKFDDDTTKNVF